MLIIHFISLLIFLLNLQKNYQIRKISLSLLKKIHTSYLLVSFFSNQKKEALAYGFKHDVFIFFLCRVDTQVTKHKLAIKQLIIYFSFLIFFYWWSWLWVHKLKLYNLSLNSKSNWTVLKIPKLQMLAMPNVTLSALNQTLLPNFIFFSIF
jgi:hypothetical protein